MNNWFSPLYSLLFIALWRISYDAANGVEPMSQYKTRSVSCMRSLDAQPAPQKEWAEKAVRRYAESQDKKWRNWQEAMFD